MTKTYKFEIGENVEISTYDGVWGNAVVIDQRTDDYDRMDYKVTMEKRKGEDWVHPDFWAFECEVKSREIKMPLVESAFGDGSRWEEI